MVLFLFLFFSLQEQYFRTFQELFVKIRQRILALLSSVFFFFWDQPPLFSFFFVSFCFLNQ